jgi:hypothetical protein
MGVAIGARAGDGEKDNIRAHPAEPAACGYDHPRASGRAGCLLF